MNIPAIFIDMSCYKLGKRVIMYMSVRGIMYMSVRGIDVASVSMIF